MTTMPDPADHAAHDQLLVAVYAAGDASGRELAEAATLVSTCAECAALHRDLRSLSSSLASVPAPSRPRDFRLTAVQAAALARPTGWRRILAPFAGAKSAAGPLAASLAALGVAGLLLGGPINLGFSGSGSAALAPQAAESGDTAVTGGQGNFGTSSSASGPATAVSAPSEAPAASGEAALGPSAAGSVAPVDMPSAAASAAASIAPTAAPSQIAAVATTEPNPVTPSNSDKSAGGAAVEATAPAGSFEANMAPVRPSPTAPAQRAASETPAGPSPIVIASVLLLIAGVVLGMLRLAARRLV